MTNPMQTHGAASWIQHSGSDPAGARKFYETVLGWTVNDMPMQDGSSYSGIVVGENPIGGFMPMPVPAGEWTIYITVDNVDARFKSALDNGAEGIDEPADFPGVGRMAKIRDPYGASISLITYESMQG
ncbi:VOC family protein [Nitratireductor sp. XY-223]|uniref:VOC family protein n=1 Tax=Nitratireductor sp. XY-223 TaxID=2561926 RepID=UPI0010AAE1C3|nr:VOC family protein [Nitratireductor sp. XY-223]